MLYAAFAVATAVAAPNELGRDLRVGVGIAAGLPSSVGLTWMATPREAISFHIGPTVTTSGLHTRVQVEQWARPLKAWAWGELGLGWQAGVSVNLVFGQASLARGARLGILAGPRIDLRLKPAPVVGFLEVSPVLYPLDLLPDANFLPAGITVAIGARWFFRRAGSAVEGEPGAAEPSTLPARDLQSPDELPAGEPQAPAPDTLPADDPQAPAPDTLPADDPQAPAPDTLPADDPQAPDPPQGPAALGGDLQPAAPASPPALPAAEGPPDVAEPP